jgi:hypothetical protein
MPDYLTAGAKDIWFEEIERVVVAGINANHSSTFARYCEMEAAVRKMWREGKLPTSQMLSEVRKLSELLGIAGIASRTSNGQGIGSPLDQNSDPYADLPEA